MSATSVIDVYKCDNLQSALLECDRKIGRLDEAMSPITGRSGLAVGFTVEVAPTYALLLLAAQSNLGALRAYIDGTSSHDPRST